MGPYPYYGIYQAERAKTTAELRAADALIGEFAAALVQLGSNIARPARAMRPKARPRMNTDPAFLPTRGGVWHAPPALTSRNTAPTRERMTGQ
jgi:hypothetical protein